MNFMDCFGEQFPSFFGGRLRLDMLQRSTFIKLNGVLNGVQATYRSWWFLEREMTQMSTRTYGISGLLTIFGFGFRATEPMKSI